MQYKVPQDVQIEDKILPFMTLRQLVITGLGGGITYVVYLLLEHQSSQIWMPPVLLLGFLTVAIAFLKIRGILFVDFMLLLLERYLNETKRVWVKSAGNVFPKISTTEKKKEAKKEVEKKKTSNEDITQLSKMLDTGMKS